MSDLNVNVYCYFNRPEWEREYDEFCAYQSDEPACDDWFDDDGEFEADNDNASDCFSIYFTPNEKVGKVSAEVDALRLFEVLSKLHLQQVCDVDIEFGLCGSPRVNIEFLDDDGYFREGSVTFLNS